MRRSSYLFILILGAAFLFFLGTDSFAASTLVQGDSSSLGILTNTRYLDNEPVLVFSEQMGKKISLVDKVDNIVLWDSTWQDLAVELAAQLPLESLHSAVGVEEDGVYELFLRRPQSAGGNLWPKVEIDGKQASGDKPYSSYSGFKYVKLIETKLSVGRHRIEVKDLAEGSKVYLMRKSERVQAEKTIWRRINKEGVGASYILSRDFKTYVPHERDYKLKARMVSDFAASEEEIAKEAAASAPVVGIDDQRFSLDSYLGGESLLHSNRFWWESKTIDLAKGSHEISLLSSDKFKVDLVILEPEIEKEKGTIGQQPEIIFKKINPTKYLVKVSGATNPFWLVFSESYHSQWRLYQLQAGEGTERDGLQGIIANYPRVRVSEARHSQRFTLGDIRYLLRPADVQDHFLVNSYANGWYINPKKLALGKEFTLILYFWPQSLFYLGLLISGLTLASGLAYLSYDYFGRKKREQSS